MNRELNSEVHISIDVKGYQIRIFQDTYRQLGEPKIIQLLIDPQNQAIAILCPKFEKAGGQELRVRRTKEGCELFSKALILKMKEANSNLNQDGTYRLTGNVDPAKRLAIFPMKSMQLVANMMGHERRKVQ